MRVHPDDGLPPDRAPSLLDEQPFRAGVSGIRRTAEFSPCGTWRYRLVRQWAEEGTFARFVMLNPSAADTTRDDPTVRRCISFARVWGHAGVVVLNAYALRATDPTHLASHPSPVGDGNANDVVIAQEAELAAGSGVPFVVAWGVHARPDRVREVWRLLATANVQVRCLGTTKEGAPRHPLYVAASTELQPWQVP